MRSACRRHNVYLYPPKKGVSRSKEIFPLVILSPEDEDLKSRSWQLTSNNFYFRRTLTKGETLGLHGPFETVRLHQAVLERVIGRSLRTGEYVDHRSGDVLDNRRGNLRLATAADNTNNQKLRSTNTSGFRGVVRRGQNSWTASIKHKGVLIHLGYFRCPEEASHAYLKAAEELQGEYAAHLNRGVSACRAA